MCCDRYKTSGHDFNLEADPPTTAKRKRKRAAGSEYSVTYRQYATDVQGSVLGLLDGDGTLDKNDRYEYDPYGAIENESQLNKEAKDNAIRFQGFAYDDSAALYDMQARHYRPEIGRFLSRDRYESSDLDFNYVSAFETPSLQRPCSGTAHTRSSSRIVCDPE